MSPRETAPFRAVVLDGIQDFTIRAPILNFVGGMARNKRFQESRDANLGGFLKITFELTGGQKLSEAVLLPVRVERFVRQFC